eukprot:s203_g25.t1
MSEHSRTQSDCSLGTLMFVLQLFLLGTETSSTSPNREEGSELVRADHGAVFTAMLRQFFSTSNVLVVTMNFWSNHASASFFIFSGPESKEPRVAMPESSLEKHLRDFHQNNVRKKKLDTKDNDFTAPVLHVPGCSYDKVAAALLRGRYTAKGWHHGKPLYHKEAGGNEVPVALYFWDGRDGDKLHGWWFSPKEGSAQVWAYNASNRNPGELRVPSSGWRVPWNGGIDERLQISTECQNVIDASNHGFKLCWEFVASAGGGQEDWQPMSKDMNDALEKRWADGWHGDDGTDTFHVHDGHFTYGIDCKCMLQWNVRTGRRRWIRRGQVRPDAMAMLPLAEKDAQVEQLQSERNSLAQERDALIAKVERLEREKKTLQRSLDDRDSLAVERHELLEAVVKLELEKKALAKSQADHAGQMVLQEAWRMSRQLQTQICSELSPWDAAFSNIQQVLIEACPGDHYGACRRMWNVSVTGLRQICNIRIWKDYEFRREQVRKELESRDCSSVPSVVSALPPHMCNWVQLDAKINEVLLIHGTMSDKVEQIANFGFDERLARENGLYGQGVYFTDQSCKSFQYSGAKWQNAGCLIIARVILGHPCEARGPLKQLKVEPLVDVTNPCKGRCHSVIAKPGTPTGGQKQVHREFVLFNGTQAYPEMIVHFKT